ncbi:uncharacterized protein B0H64DRAFT_150186 [Chaetomium fimeti]|uniref:Uncharacterized protein n=1 Tax=Chaetomium fimeti TaxID=1854472 RepID=A0AAE0LS92_9PEZI|nr:hypothetical protein B0H64DRAFT_150186 [Chaetomium fimeti]
MSKRPEGSGAHTHFQKVVELQGEATTGDDAPGLKPDCPFSCPTGCSFPLIFQPEPNDPQNISAQHASPRPGLSSSNCCSLHPSWPCCPLIRQFSATCHLFLLSDPGHAPPKTCFITPQKDLSVVRQHSLQHDFSFSPTGFHLPQGFGHAGAPVVVYHSESSNQLALECLQECLPWLCPGLRPCLATTTLNWTRFTPPRGIFAFILLSWEVHCAFGVLLFMLRIKSCLFLSVDPEAPQ